MGLVQHVEDPPDRPGEHHCRCRDFPNEGLLGGCQHADDPIIAEKDFERLRTKEEPGPKLLELLDDRFDDAFLHASDRWMVHGMDGVHVVEQAENESANGDLLGLRLHPRRDRYCKKAAPSAGGTFS